MANSWKNSKPLSDKSWAILKANKYLLAFPFLGFAVSLIWIAIIGIPAVLAFAANSNFLAWALIVIGLFGMTFVVSVFAAGLVGAADTEIRGQDSSVGHGLGRAFGRLGALFVWSIIQTIVGVILGVLRGDGQGNVVAVILRNVAAAAAGVMWSIITLFVLPSIIIDNLGAIDAIKKSASMAKERWGTELSGGVRIGGRIVLTLTLPGIALVVLGAFAAGATNGGIALGGALALIAIGVLLLVFGALLGSAMRGVFSVALYHYVHDGQVLAGFTADELQSAVRTK